MPRKARIDVLGALQRIAIRGIERKAIFKVDTDREDFIVSFSMGFGLQMKNAFYGSSAFVEETLKYAGKVN